MRGRADSGELRSAQARPGRSCTTSAQAAIMLGLSRHLQNKDSEPWPIPPKPASAPGRRTRPAQRNASLKSTLRTAVKKVKKAIAAGDKAAAAQQMQASQAVIDRIADKKIVHKNTASRTKSRLAQAIKAMA